MPYIRLWMQRESFAYCYTHTNEISAAMVNNIIRMLADKAHDVTNGGEVYAKIMARARERDPVYDGVDHATDEAAPRPPTRRWRETARAAHLLEPSPSRRR